MAGPWAPVSSFDRDLFTSGAGPLDLQPAGLDQSHLDVFLLDNGSSRLVASGVTGLTLPGRSVKTGVESSGKPEARQRSRSKRDSWIQFGSSARRRLPGPLELQVAQPETRQHLVSRWQARSQEQT